MWLDNARNVNKIPKCGNFVVKSINAHPFIRRARVTLNRISTFLGLRVHFKKVIFHLRPGKRFLLFWAGYCKNIEYYLSSETHMDLLYEVLYFLLNIPGFTGNDVIIPRKWTLVVESSILNTSKYSYGWGPNSDSD